MKIERFVPYYIDHVDKKIVGITDRTIDKRVITVDIGETGEENKLLAHEIIPLMETLIEQNKIKADDPHEQD